MPCRSDYLEPDHRERELQRAAKLHVFVSKALGMKVPVKVAQAAESIYAQARDGSTVDAVPSLCALIKNMSKTDQDRIIYNARNAQSRDLANWWEEHQEADWQRVAAEEASAKKAALRKSALAKLTPAERKALGL